jgi:hypothetical protein
MNLGNAHQQTSLLAEEATSLMQKSNPACMHPAHMQRDVYSRPSGCGLDKLARVLQPNSGGGDFIAVARTSEFL